MMTFNMNGLEILPLVWPIQGEQFDMVPGHRAIAEERSAALA
jgi:hypothetical protein